jgi:hypothetical protein
MPTGLNPLSGQTPIIQRMAAITDDILECLHVNMTQVLEYQIPHDEKGAECTCAVE